MSVACGANNHGIWPQIYGSPNRPPVCKTLVFPKGPRGGSKAQKL